MKDKLKGITIGVGLGILIAGLTPACADYGIKVFAHFKEISLYLEGENKVTTEAMIYKGTTYVPVRSVSDVIGKSNRSNQTLSVAVFI